MSFRARLALLCAAALAIALATTGVAAYISERSSLSGELDGLLRARAGQVTPDVVQQVLAANYLLPKQRRIMTGNGAGAKVQQSAGRPLAPPTGGVVGFGDLQLVTSGGEHAVAARSAMASAIPVDGSARAVAAGQMPPLFRTVSLPGGSFRVYVFRAAPRVAGEIAGSLAPLNASLRDLRVTFVGVGLGAILLVGLLASLVARQALRPVTALSGAAARVIDTGDLRQRVSVAGRGRDELARLAATINAMLVALERSVGSQRQLVADASHELRTPLTTLIANLQLLDEPGGLQAGDARELVATARSQAEELAVLVSDLVELARTSEVRLHLDEVRLDLVAVAAMEHVRSRSLQVEFRADVSPCTVWGDGELLERAIGNLLDNAAKWTPSGGSVDLTVSGGEVVVRDDGPGIAASDLPFVFDRFYRSSTARGRPGSGLGLAIVRQIAELHGGVATAASTESGAVLRVALPPVSDPGASAPPATHDEGGGSGSVEPDHRREVLGDRPDVA